MTTLEHPAPFERADDAAPHSERLLLHAATGLASGSLALAAAAPGAAGWRAPFFPDLVLLAERAGEWPAATLAGFAFGCLVSALLPARGGNAALIRFLAILNPAMFSATIAGAGALLLATASLVFWRGVFPLGGAADYRTPIGAAVAVAAAPLVANPVLAFYPAFFLLAPLLSPWGLAPRRALGFATVVFAPLFMIAAGAAYIAWLFPPDDAQSWAGAIMHPVAAGDFALLLAAPGPIFALAGASVRQRVAGLVFLLCAGGAIAITASAGAGGAPMAGAVAAAHIAWVSSCSRRPAFHLGLGFAGGAAAAMIAQGWPAP